MEREYEWDTEKSARNLAKHGLSFEAAKDFDWDHASIEEDRKRDYGEVRFIAVGPITNRLHVLVFTWRRNRIRVIGLRKANEREKLRYENTQEAR